ncbi:MAG TPA: MotA/TolQ/ExbB proton channel family protein, partial [Candidatus Latescibacteria bacterium]|nr:MotA/TolQ/ExbB proton channel family protein [Candidatus Latescibacterota bacterium]
LVFQWIEVSSSRLTLRKLEDLPEPPETPGEWRVGLHGSRSGEASEEAPEEETPESANAAITMSDKEVWFWRVLGGHGLGKENPIARHVYAIFRAGMTFGRLDTDSLVKHTERSLFRYAGVLRAIVAMFIVVGLFGTVSKLVVKLPDLSDFFASRSLTQPEWKDALTKLASALEPSMWGVFLTIIGVVAFAIFQRVACLPLVHQLEHLTLNVWTPRYYPTDKQRADMMVQITGKQISESHALLQQTSESIRDVGEFINSIKDNTGRLSTNIKAAATAFERLDQITGRIESFSTKFEKASAMLAQSHHESQQELKTLVSEYLTPMKRTVEDAKALQDGLIEPVRNQNAMLGQLLADAKEYEAVRIQLMEAAKDVRSAFSALADQQKNALEGVGNRILNEQKGLYEEVAGGFKYLKEGPIREATSNLVKAHNEVATTMRNLVNQLEAHLNDMDRKVEQREAHNKAEIAALAALIPGLRNINESASKLVDPEGALRKTLVELTEALNKIEQGRGSMDELKGSIQGLKKAVEGMPKPTGGTIGGGDARVAQLLERVIVRLDAVIGLLRRNSIWNILGGRRGRGDENAATERAMPMPQARLEVTPVPSETPPRPWYKHPWSIAAAVVVGILLIFGLGRAMRARAQEGQMIAARAVIDSVKAVPGVWTHASDSLLVAEANMITARTQLAVGDHEEAALSLETAVSAARGAIPAARSRAARADAENEINDARRAVEGARDALTLAWRGGPRPGLRDSLRTAVSNLEAAENAFAEGDFPKAQESAASAIRVANEVNAFASTPRLGPR